MRLGLRSRLIPASLVLALAAMLALSACRQRVGHSVDTRIGRLEFTRDFATGYPTKETVETLHAYVRNSN